jgi:hypothetical protein
MFLKFKKFYKIKALDYSANKECCIVFFLADSGPKILVKEVDFFNKLSDTISHEQVSSITLNNKNNKNFEICFQRYGKATILLKESKIFRIISFTKPEYTKWPVSIYVADTANLQAAPRQFSCEFKL